LYRCRWQIEVFFKQIKQTLQLSDFLGTSANAVRFTGLRARALGISPAAFQGAVLCVGPATAEAAQAADWPVQRIPERRFDAHGVLELVREALPPRGRRFLIPGSASARDVLPEGLRALGARVDARVAYHTRAAPVDAAWLRDQLLSGALDALTFTSPSTVRHFVELLDDLLDETSAHQIYLVAHSMGTRIATRAFVTLAGDRVLADLDPIREMILVAPDIDADLFRSDIAPRLASNGIHVTLYASSADRALMASKAFHGYPRAGDSGEGLVIVDGVETVDASVASAGLIGHSYFSEDRRIMEDIFGILQTGQRADNRFGLEAVDSASGRYWTFRK